MREESKGEEGKRGGNFFKQKFPAIWYLSLNQLLHVQTDMKFRIYMEALVGMKA